MGNIGDMDLQQPAAVIATLDIDRVIKVPRRLTVNRNDWKFAKIVAPL